MAKKRKDFSRQLDDDGRVRYRARFTIGRGKVDAFTVQLEVKYLERWRVVLRYDSVHGFAHMDRYHRNPNQPQRKESLDLTYADALTYAINDVYARWPWYIERFLSGEYP